jgi:hypothetical protein
MEELSTAIVKLQEEVRGLKRQREPSCSCPPPLPQQRNQPPDALALLSSALSMVDDLKEENRQLKLDAFWADFNLAQFERALTYVRDRPRCSCYDCICLGRTSGDFSNRFVKCSYIPWIRKKILDSGMLFSDLQSTDKTLHVPSSGYVYVSNEDVHFTASYNTKLGVAYGVRLWKAQFVNDPELEKLVKLFWQVPDESHLDIFMKMVDGLNPDAAKRLCPGFKK